MPRSKRYAAYKYEWTLLVNSLLTHEDSLDVDYGTEKEAENQRQEWYAFLGACQHEAERPRNSPESKQEMSQFYKQASQIACKRNGGTLHFVKKSATPSGKALRAAIEDQLPGSGPGPSQSPDLSDLHSPADIQGEDEEDPYAAAMRRSGLDPDADG